MDTVIHTYDKIANDFSNTRNYVWDMVKLFLNKQPNGSYGLEIGCGNGKNMKYKKDLNIIGVDKCNAFLNICKQQQLNVVYSDCCYLPFKDNSFDFVISIAVFHHLDNIHFTKAINEMKRVMKKGAIGLITIWSVENQSRKKFIDGDNMVPFNGINRYYNIFSKERLTLYLENNYTIYNDHGNWVIELKV
tara:strand:- start:58 stop:627 length:570 start_codon:yes stop_codon:yes gene_type:complete